MTATASAEMIVELEAAVRDGSPEHCERILRRQTELLVSGADRLNPTQIGVFDDVVRRVTPLPRKEFGRTKSLFEMLYVSATQYTMRVELRGRFNRFRATASLRWRESSNAG